MMNKIAVAAALTAVAMAQYPAVETKAAEVVTTVAAEPAVYYYADYDNVVIAAEDNLYYTSALTQEAVDRTKQGSASSWSAPAKIAVKDLYNAKGATFCGEKYAKEAPEGGKYGSLVVADEGNADHKGKVVAWDVVPDEAAPHAVKLANPWTVYDPADATPTDVECGPNNGLFIADKGNKGIYWVTGANFKAKKQNEYEAVTKDCGAAVANVRSIAYDEVNENLVWSNNDDAVTENAGVFEADQPKTGVQEIDCEAEKCDAWSKDCSSDIKKNVDAKAEEQVWGVADAWGKVQVSKGDANIYGKDEKPIADVPKEATYLESAHDENRDVLLVADQKEGAVYAVSQGSASAKKVADVADAYGVAYNNGWGWKGEDAVPDSTSSMFLAAGSLVVLALSLF